MVASGVSASSYQGLSRGKMGRSFLRQQARGIKAAPRQITSLLRDNSYKLEVVFFRRVGEMGPQRRRSAGETASTSPRWRTVRRNLASAGVLGVGDGVFLEGGILCDGGCRGCSAPGIENSESYPAIEPRLFVDVEVLLMLPRASIAMAVGLWLDNPDSPMGESWVGVGSGMVVIIGDEVSCEMRLDGVRMSGEYKSDSSPGVTIIDQSTWQSL